MIFRLLIAAVLFLAFGPAAIDTHAATLVVTKTADTADGVCDADCSLREAVAAAANGDDIGFSTIFNTPQTVTLSLGQIVIDKKLAIYGTGGDRLTISGNNTNRIFRVSGGVSVVLTAMKLTNGIATTQSMPSGGGAIAVLQSSVTLLNMVLSNNAAPVDTFGLGGGIYVDRGTLSVQGSSISNNGGGAIYSTRSTINISFSTISYNQQQGVHGSGVVSALSTVTVVDSTVNRNTGTGIGNSSGPLTVIRCTVLHNGGGVGAVSSPSTLTVEDSLIRHNEPSGGVGFTGLTAIIRNTVIDNNFANGIGGDGGGISKTGTMYILNSSITNNRAFESGGGILSENGHLYLTNSTVSGNRADNGGGNCNCPGGGIYNRVGGGNPPGSIIVTNSTIANNRSAGKGGGIRNDPGGILILRNSIVGGNMAFSNEVDVSGAAHSDGFNLIGNTTGSTGWLTSDLLNVNSLLGPLGINGGSTRTHALMPGSPAINAGNNELARDPFDNSILISDQRGAGFGRIVSGTVDIGAYEADYSELPVILSGQVLTSNSRGVSKAIVTLTDSVGDVRYTHTNPFGYYRFLNIPSGATYTISVSHKSYQFDSPQFITVDRDRDDLIFFAQ